MFLYIKKKGHNTPQVPSKEEEEATINLKTKALKERKEGRKEGGYIDLNPTNLVPKWKQMGDCSGDAPSCIDKTAALELKIGAIVTILVTSGIGVCIPLLGRTFPFLRPDRDFFFVVKAFAAGVILGTAFIHMLPDAFETLGNPCLAENPWGKFPFAGLISMFAALSTLLIDFWANTYYQNKNKLASSHAAHGDGVDHDDEHGHGSSEKQVSSPIHDHGHGHSHGIVSVTGEAEAMKMQIRQRIISQVILEVLFSFFFNTQHSSLYVC